MSSSRAAPPGLLVGELANCDGFGLRVGRVACGVGVLEVPDEEVGGLLGLEGRRDQARRASMAQARKPQVLQAASITISPSFGALMSVTAPE
ncbi:MAG: hypothetical protein ACOYM2_16095 [Rectinemataceae bacterium]